MRGKWDMAGPIVVVLLAMTGCVPPAMAPGPVSTETPGPTFVITLADDNQTITLRVSQQFLLQLGADYDWTVSVAEPTIVSRVIGVSVAHGAQGVYQARAPGQTTLMATGEPFCRRSQPPCLAPSRLFHLTLIVEP